MSSLVLIVAFFFSLIASDAFSLQIKFQGRLWTGSGSIYTHSSPVLKLSVKPCDTHSNCQRTFGEIWRQSHCYCFRTRCEI